MTDAQSNRPRFDKDVATAAATKLVASMITDGLLDECQREDSIEDIAKQATEHMDGYELMKTLERNACWSGDMPTAEALDGWSSFVYDELKARQSEWVTANSITPDLAIGTRVTFGKWKPETGEIVGIYECGPAQYLVKVDGDPHAEGQRQSRRIVNFEDASPSP